MVKSAKPDKKKSATLSGLSDETVLVMICEMSNKLLGMDDRMTRLDTKLTHDIGK